MWGKPVFSGWDKFGTLISKFEDKWWDIDIKNITMSHCDQTKCNSSQRKLRYGTILFSPRTDLRFDFQKRLPFALFLLVALRYRGH